MTAAVIAVATPTLVGCGAFQADLCSAARMQELTDLARPFFRELGVDGPEQAAEAVECTEAGFDELALVQAVPSGSQTAEDLDEVTRKLDALAARLGWERPTPDLRDDLAALWTAGEGRDRVWLSLGPSREITLNNGDASY